MLTREEDLKPTDRVELIEGEIVEMSPIGRRHKAFVGNLTERLATRLGGRAVLWVQNPITLSPHTEPQPDLVVLGKRAVSYRDRDAEAGDVLLVIEVAESSLGYDRSTKLRLYAEAGIPEYWIVNLRDDCVEVRREPEPDARRYGSVRIARRGERIELVGLPGVSVAVDDLLPSPAR
jgi:Uma2 family endonuclease